jgi:hypothetical protein
MSGPKPCQGSDLINGNWHLPASLPASLPRRQPPGWPKGRPCPAKGTRMPWRKGWGTFGDRRTKLSRLALRIWRELAAEYVCRGPLDRRRLRAASEYLALAEKTRREIGHDSKATRRAATQLERVAESKLAMLDRRQDRPAPTSGVELLERLAQERTR